MRPTLFSALQRAASFTVRGAAITLGSTLVSCTGACYIEQGAHRMLYRYFPHKYSNVDWANGLTQEQLDDVRGQNVVVTEALLPANNESPKEQEHHGGVDDVLPLQGAMLWDAAADTTTTTTTNTMTYRADNSTTRMTTTSRLEAAANKNTTNSTTSISSTRFWKEQDEQIAKAAVALPLNEIQACAMTC